MAQKNSDLAQRLGAALRALRERSQLSQADVARLMGLNASAQTQLGRYERGLRIPRADTLHRFLVAIGASYADLEARLESSQPESSRLSPRRKVSKRTLKLTRELLRLSENKSR